MVPINYFPEDVQEMIVDNGDRNAEIAERLIDEEWVAYIRKPVQVLAKRMWEDFEVNTLEGTMKGKAGSYLVGVEGELYPVAESIFKKTYEKVGGEK